MIGSTTLRLGPRQATFQAVALPDLRPEPTVSATEVTFVQTAGGRTGVPAPRRVCRPPFVQISAPLAWTTLVARPSGPTARSTHQLTGASPFPRHWVYDTDGKLLSKSGLIDFSSWYRQGVREAQPLGRPGLPRPHHRGGVGARAPALHRADAGLGQAHDPRRQEGHRDHRAGRGRPTSCSWCSTAWSGSRSTASAWPSTARVRCTASGPSSRVASAPPRSGPSPSCKLAVATADEVDRDALERAERRAPPGGAGLRCRRAGTTSEGDHQRLPGRRQPDRARGRAGPARPRARPRDRRARRPTTTSS